MRKFYPVTFNYNVVNQYDEVYYRTYKSTVYRKLSKKHVTLRFLEAPTAIIEAIFVAVIDVEDMTIIHAANGDTCVTSWRRAALYARRDGWFPRRAIFAIHSLAADETRKHPR